jgi:hypothetical protein
MRNITIITCSLLATLSVYGQDQHNRPLVPPVNRIQPVLNILKESKTPGSIEFFGKCESFVYPGFPDFPRMADSPATGSPVQKLRSIFSNDPSMQVRQVSDGSIEMIEENIPQDILNITIADIHFTGTNKSSVINNPNGAVNFVLYSPEVQKYIALHSISFPYSISMASGILGGVPDARLPQISSSFHNVTVRFLLNEIAKTFQNLWIYENCPTSAKGSRVVYIRFYQP